MADALSDTDRLPWLDAPRPAKPVASRRAQRPLFILLGLFFAGAIAVMAYLTGRSTAPVAVPAPAVRTVTPVAPTPAPTPLPTPLPAAPIAPPPPVVTTPVPPALAPVRVTPAQPRATPGKAEREATVQRKSARPAVRRPARAIVERTERAPAAPRVAAPPRTRTVWPTRPFAGPRGRVIQLGTYRTQAQADAAWWGTARAYPYLSTLPRVVVWVGPSPGRARIYQVRLAASSRREARALCHYLHRIRRGCIIV